MHRWKVGLVPAKPADRKRRRGLAAERKARRRDLRCDRSVTRSERSACTAVVPLPAGQALIVILLLSVGLWAMIWAAVALVGSMLS